MDWVKILVTLPRCPKIMHLAAALGCKRHEALGLAVEYFCWLDGISSDGLTQLTPAQVNEIFARKNLAEALCKIGWAGLDEAGCLYALDFDTHNGESAKKRVLQAEKKRRQRAAKAGQVSPKKGDNCPDFLGQEGGLDKIRYSKTEISAQRQSTVFSDATAEPRPSGNTPETAEEVQSFMQAQAVCGLKGEELATCAQAFYNDCEAVGWTLKGQPIRDWRAACRAFVARWQQNKGNRGSTAPGSFTFRSATKQNYDL